MKAFFIIILALAGTCLSMSQGTLPSSGPSFTIRDTSNTESLQDYSLGSDRDNIAHAEPSPEQNTRKQTIADSGPIRDWSNPPGFMGYSKTDVAISKRKPLSVRRYQHPKAHRCYSF